MSSSVGVILLDSRMFGAHTRKQHIIVMSNAEADWTAAASGASGPEGIASMMCDLGFTMESVLVVVAQATEHILHRHGIRRMEHT